MLSANRGSELWTETGKSGLTILRDNGVYVKYYDSDTPNSQRVGKEFSNARCTSRDDDNLLAPFKRGWSEEQTSLVPVQPRVPFYEP